MTFSLILFAATVAMTAGGLAVASVLVVIRSWQEARRG